MRAPAALQSIADAAPALGIVAAVLGVVKTMALDQPAGRGPGRDDRRCPGRHLPGRLSSPTASSGPIAAKMNQTYEEDAQFYAIIRDCLVGLSAGPLGADRGRAGARQRADHAAAQLPRHGRGAGRPARPIRWRPDRDEPRAAPDHHPPRPVHRGGHGHHGGAWKVAYADFVTAMMAFFLLLWLISSASDETKKGLADFFSNATVNIGPPGGVGGVLDGMTVMPSSVPPLPTSPFDRPPSCRRRPRTRRRPRPWARPRASRSLPPTMAVARGRAARDAAELENRPVRSGQGRDPGGAAGRARAARLQGQPADRADARGLRIRSWTATQLPMFPVGSDAMYPHTRRLLELVVEAIAELPNRVSMRGHTDSLPFAAGCRPTTTGISRPTAPTPPAWRWSVPDSTRGGWPRWSGKGRRRAPRRRSPDRSAQPAHLGRAAARRVRRPQLRPAVRQAARRRRGRLTLAVTRGLTVPRSADLSRDGGAWTRRRFGPSTGDRRIDAAPPLELEHVAGRRHAGPGRATGRRQRGAAARHRGRAARPRRVHREVRRDAGRHRARWGFAAAILDWRGQGGSDRFLADRQRGHVVQVEDYLADLAAVMARLEQLRAAAAAPDAGPLDGRAYRPALPARPARPVRRRGDDRPDVRHPPAADAGAGGARALRSSRSGSARRTRYAPGQRDLRSRSLRLRRATG